MKPPNNIKALRKSFDSVEISVRNLNVLRVTYHAPMVICYCL